MNMAEQNGLLNLAQRLVSEESFRNQMMMAPKETLITELGISRENYEALMTIIPVIVAGGIIVVGAVSPTGSSLGGWGKR